jgi:hypothetical protein
MSVDKKISRRELFKEMVSKDTVKEVMRSWYSFTKPIAEADVSPPAKKESLLEKVQRLNMTYPNKPIYTKLVNPNRKEG